MKDSTSKNYKKYQKVILVIRSRKRMEKIKIIRIHAHDPMRPNTREAFLDARYFGMNARTSSSMIGS